MKSTPATLRTALPDFSTYDYFSNSSYNEDISKVNLYYRGLIEDLQQKFFKAIDKERYEKQELEHKITSLTNLEQSDITTYQSKLEEYISQINFLRDTDRDNKDLLDRARRTIQVKDCTIADLQLLVEDKDKELEAMRQRVRFAQEEVICSRNNQSGELVDRLRSQINTMEQNYESEKEGLRTDIKYKQKVSD